MYNGRQYPNAGYPNAYQDPYQSYGSGYHTYHEGYTGYQTSDQAQGAAYPNNWSHANAPAYETTKEAEKKDAVAQEMQQQKAQLQTQRADYVSKATVLRRELDLLRTQKQDLLLSGARDRDLDMIVKENDKLQDEIHGKLKAIINVIEMLSGIIKDDKTMADLEEELRAQKSSPKMGGGVGAKRGNGNSKSEVERSYSYVHYDTGLHWCRICDEFPETAKDYLLHLQTQKHADAAKKAETDLTPWHKLPAEPLMPSGEDAPKKRVPIKGLQFFVSAPSWYCKLCDTWIGDLHCASHHLKSQAHFQNYENFIQQNSDWEIDWLKDRDKAKSRIDLTDEGSKKKRNKKEKNERKKQKKKSKKRKKNDSSDSSSSSSSSSSSEEEDEEEQETRDKSRSIRVAMRNQKMPDKEDMSSRWTMLERLVEEHKKLEEKQQQKEQQIKEKEEMRRKEPEDKLISQWMTVQEAPQKEKDMLDSLKDRMKVKQEQERARQAELEKKQKEKERLEREQEEKRKREEKERVEAEEREKKRREQEEYERLMDKQRNQVKFKTKKRSDSEGDDDGSPRRSRKESTGNDDHRNRSNDDDRKRSSSKRLPFIGRMPLFKNKPKPEEKFERKKEIKKEEYEKPRRTRFEPGNLPRAFMPKPDVVCYPKLSCIPELTVPPPPPSMKPEEPPKPPSPPKISEDEPPPPPPPPQIGEMNNDEMQHYNGGEEENILDMYYDYNQMYGQYAGEYAQVGNGENDGTGVPLSHTMPLQPPPLPPEDDLAMLGISADDMAAQMF